MFKARVGGASGLLENILKIPLFRKWLYQERLVVFPYNILTLTYWEKCRSSSKKLKCNKS